MPLSKKKILFHSSYSRRLTGFAKNAKNILAHLASTGKYEIVEFANTMSWSDPELQTLPWRAIGSGPDEQDIIIKNNKNEITAKEMSYGLLKIDEVIEQEKPDIYIGAEDIWAFNKIIGKPWWNQMNCMIWTTLDSLPLLPDTIDLSKKIKNYYTWASFASDELNRQGFENAGCLHGAVDTKNFYKLPREKVIELRKNAALKDTDYVTGFVFKNQLRKSVPNLLEGFKIFCEQQKDGVTPKLLLHTGWHEGWNIPSLIKEKDINPEDILTTYYCSNCKKYEIRPFTGQSKDCHFCGTKGSLKTMTIQAGPSEQQLNEIYNVMNVYCHPFNSGGQEIPIQEAKLCELLTLVTDYSCGTDMTKTEAHSIKLSWDEYREEKTQFIKANTKPESIASGLRKALRMSAAEKVQKCKAARQFVLNNYSIEAVGAKLEKILDSMPHVNTSEISTKSRLNPSYVPRKTDDNKSWLKDIYCNILGEHTQESDPTIKHWLRELQSGSVKREEILRRFQLVALKQIEQSSASDRFKEDLLGKSKNDRVGLAVYGTKMDALAALSVIKSIKETYKDCLTHLIAPQEFFPIIGMNPWVDKLIPFFEDVKNQKQMEKKYFKVFYLLRPFDEQDNIHTQNKDIIGLNIFS